MSNKNKDKWVIFNLFLIFLNGEIFTFTKKQLSSCFKQNFYLISLKVGIIRDLDYSFKGNILRA